MNFLITLPLLVQQVSDENKESDHQGLDVLVFRQYSLLYGFVTKQNIAFERTQPE